jgi:hypothetical protein
MATLSGLAGVEGRRERGYSHSLVPHRPPDMHVPPPNDSVNSTNRSAGGNRANGTAARNTAVTPPLRVLVAERCVVARSVFGRSRGGKELLMAYVDRRAPSNPLSACSRSAASGVKSLATFSRSRVGQ